MRERDIEEVSAVVAERDFWGDGKEIFIRLGLREDVRAAGGVHIRTRRYLEQADDHASDRILRYFELGDHQPDTQPWPRRGLKLFVSHRDDQRAPLALLAIALQRYGVATFLAHDAIPIGRPWRQQIEAGLRSMDCLLAYCSQSFATSEWTGQEVGYALGKDVPVVPVIAGERPPGLLEQFQAARNIVRNEQGAARVAEVVYESLKVDARVKPRLSEALARELKFAASFDYARFLAEQLVDINLLTATARADIHWAFEINDQTEDARANEGLRALLLND